MLVFIFVVVLSMTLKGSHSYVPRSAKWCNGRDCNLNLIVLALSDRSVEEMVSVLKAEQGKDDDKEACCLLSLVKTEDEAKVSSRLIVGPQRITRNLPNTNRVSRPRRKRSRSLTPA